MGPDTVLSEWEQRGHPDSFTLRNPCVLQAISEHSLDAIVLSDDKTRYVDANPAACALLGYSREELLQKSLWDLIPTHQQATGEKSWHSFLTSFSLNREYEVVTRDGSTRNVEVRAVANILPGLHLLIIRDATARREWQAQLAKSQAMLSEVEHLAGVGSWHLDLRTNVLNWSQHLFRLVGVTPELFQPSLDQFFALLDLEEREKVRRVIEETIAQVGTFDQHFTIGAYDGVKRTLHSRGQVVCDSNGVPIRFFGTVQDVTEAKRAEEVRNRLLSQLKTLSARIVEIQESERRAIARELHDELGQALTGLKLMLEMFRLDTTSDNGNGKRFAQCGAMLGTVNELLSRVREMSLTLRPPMLDDLGLLPTLLWHIDRYSAQTAVEVDFKYAGLEQRFLPAVETAAYRIVQEALTNVARHARVNRAKVRLWTDGKALHLKVEDSGVGLGSEVLTSSTCSGLAGMRERVHLLRGEIHIRSTPLQGCCVQASLPYEGAPETAAEKDGTSG